MTYPDVLYYLNTIEATGIKPGLDTTRAVLLHLPFYDRLSPVPMIHVAGTNGKGSTSHFAAGILEAAGYTVGLFTSPHLLDVRERICIGSTWISETDFTEAVCTVKDTAALLLENGTIQRMPTFFEYTFLTAMHYFSKQALTAAVIETGLGGRWDATTVITPAVSLITTISRDHTHLLGNRLQEIAAEKAGIIKTAVPVVSGCKVRSVAHRVLKARAAELDAPFFCVWDDHNHLEASEQDDHTVYTYTSSTAPNGVDAYQFRLRLPGEHQGRNAAAAVKTLELLARRTGLDIPQSAVINGLLQSGPPARIETFAAGSGVILDGAHNVESITALTRYLERSGKRDLTLIFGVLADKNYKAMFRLLKPHVGRVILTRPDSTRALPPRNVLQGLKMKTDNPIMVEETLEEAYRVARQFPKEILVTGSFYLVGLMRRLIIEQGDRNIQPTQ